MRVMVTDASENHALAVTRSLGVRGISITACDDKRLAKSSYSTFCADSFVYPSPRINATDFIETLLSKVKRGNYQALFPMTEKTILPLSLHRHRFQGLVTIPLASHTAITRAFDKAAVVELARQSGVPIPKTICIKSIDDLAASAKEIGFPVVIKPSTSEVLVTDDRVVSTGKPQYAFNEADIQLYCERHPSREQSLLVQEFVPGVGVGTFALFNRGEPRAWFAHRRLRDVVPTGSGSALRESVPLNPAMKEYAERLLRGLDWHGVAMVEFKIDSRDNTPKIMEINGRFWNSLPLAIAAGVDFPSLLYRMAMDGDIAPVNTYRTGVQCRWLLGDLRHLLSVMQGAPKGWSSGFPARIETLRAVLSGFHRSIYDDDFVRGDLIPGFIGLIDFLINKAPNYFVKSRRIFPSG